MSNVFEETSMNRHRTFFVAAAVVAFSLTGLTLYQAGGDEEAPSSVVAPGYASDVSTGTVPPVDEHAELKSTESVADVAAGPMQSIAGLVLRGTIVTGAAGAGSAFVSEGDDTGSVRYQVGDVVPGGGTLIAVMDRSVDISTDAGIETLTLDFATSTGVASMSSVGVEGQNASLAAALQEARGDGVPPEEPPTEVEPVTAPTADDLRRQAAIELALEH